uniref:Uncharacterized protein n=1 Tax=Solanum lycopersicum TaxID=4081 RepID=A0A3Q7G283_SOLLC
MHIWLPNDIDFFLEQVCIFFVLVYFQSSLVVFRVAFKLLFSWLLCKLLISG